MSTEIAFDFRGLQQAIEFGDTESQLGLYADSAEVWVFESSQTARPMQVLRGKSSIRQWVDSMSSPLLEYTVAKMEMTRDNLNCEVRYRYPDDSELACNIRAHVSRGQITHETITFTGSRSPGDER